MVIYEQSAVIPFRWTDKKLEILIITTLSGKNWTIPKGLVEPELSVTQSAEMEAYEEAGIKGTIYPDIIGEYQYYKWQGTCKVKVFPFKVREILNIWPEATSRKRNWIYLDQVGSFIQNKELLRIILELPFYLKKIGANPMK
jgi:phosphohistidine phosphatase